MPSWSKEWHRDLGLQGQEGPHKTTGKQGLADVLALRYLPCHTDGST